MSGHSKWSTIKRKKGAQDAKRSKIFSSLVKEIDIAVREGGADPESNPRLRLAIANAKGANMPKDNIERAVNKANRDPSDLQEVTYEGYAPNGIAVFIESLTDNNQRTVGNIRAIFNKRGGNLATNGSVGFLFERKGIITVPKERISDKEMFELEIIDAGAEDLDYEGEYLIITTSLETFGKVRKQLEAMETEPENAELQRIPMEYKQLDTEDAVKVLRIIEELEYDDDVQNVYHNLDVTDEVIRAMEG